MCHLGIWTWFLTLVCPSGYTRLHFCMLMCSCICLCSCMCTHTHMCLWRVERMMSDVLLSLPSYFSFEPGSLSEPELTNLLMQASLEGSEFCPCLLPQHWSYRYALSCLGARDWNSGPSAYTSCTQESRKPHPPPGFWKNIAFMWKNT